MEIQNQLDDLPFEHSDDIGDLVFNMEMGEHNMNGLNLIQELGLNQQNGKENENGKTVLDSKEQNENEDEPHIDLDSDDEDDNLVAITTDFKVID